jgi:hypothetical protein
MVKYRKKTALQLPERQLTCVDNDVGLLAKRPNMPIIAGEQQLPDQRLRVQRMRRRVSL